MSTKHTHMKLICNPESEQQKVQVIIEKHWVSVRSENRFPPISWGLEIQFLHGQQEQVKYNMHQDMQASVGTIFRDLIQGLLHIQMWN